MSKREDVNFGEVTLGGVPQVVGGGTVTVLERDSAGKVLTARGTTAAGSLTGAGWAKGALYTKTDAGAGVKGVYENIGTTSVASFNLIGDVTAGEITLAQGNVLVGNASGVAAALSAKTDTAILIGNGTTITANVLSSDVTMTNAGAVTIANEAVTVGKMADLPRGSIISGQTAGNRPTALDAKTSGQILVGDGTDVLSVAVSGDVTLAANGAVTIGAGKVVETMLAVPTSNALNAQRIARAVFDPTTNAGERTQAAHTLAVTIPDNALLVRAWYDVITTFTSASDAATIAISVEGANDVVTATAISAGGNVWDAGLHEGIQVGTTLTMVKTSAARLITATVAGGEDLTAGKLVLFVEYVVSD